VVACRANETRVPLHGFPQKTGLNKMAHQESEQEFAVQIMMLLIQQQARPDIPPLDSLPGPPLPGIEQYVQLMQVFHASSCFCPKNAAAQAAYRIAVNDTMPCHCVMLCCLKTYFPTFIFGVPSAHKMWSLCLNMGRQPCTQMQGSCWS